jgi:hypothetical protein
MRLFFLARRCLTVLIKHLQRPGNLKKKGYIYMQGLVTKPFFHLTQCFSARKLLDGK